MTNPIENIRYHAKTGDIGFSGRTTAGAIRPASFYIYCHACGKRHDDPKHKIVCSCGHSFLVVTP